MAPAWPPTAVNAMTSGTSQNTACNATYFVCLDLVCRSFHFQGVNGQFYSTVPGVFPAACYCYPGWSGDTCNQRLWPCFILVAEAIQMSAHKYPATEAPAWVQTTVNAPGDGEASRVMLVCGFVFGQSYGIFSHLHNSLRPRHMRAS
jgi:hypothetical protein